jgi:hypothetical protein
MFKTVRALVALLNVSTKSVTTIVESHGEKFIKTVSDLGTGYVPLSMPMEAMIGMRDGLLQALKRHPAEVSAAARQKSKVKR